MKSIYRIIALRILCLVSAATHAQIQQYSDDGTQAFIDSKSIEGEGGTFVIECDCWYPFQIPLFTYELSQSEIAENEYLDAKKALYIEEIEDRLNAESYNTYQEAQKDFFNDFSPARHQSSGYYQDIESLWNQEFSYNATGYRNGVINLALLEGLKEDKQREANGQPRAYNFGILQYQGIPLEDMTSGATNEEIGTLTNTVNTLFQERKLYLTHQRKLAYAEENLHIENFITDQYMNHYYSFGYRDEIELMGKYLIIDFSGPSNTYQIAQRHDPKIYTPESYDYFDTLTQQIAAIPSTNIDPVNPLEISVENAMFTTAMDMIKGENQEVIDFLKRSDLEDPLDELQHTLEAQDYQPYGFSLAGTVLRAYAQNTTNGIHGLDFTLGNATNSWMGFTDSAHTNRAFFIRYGYGEPYDNRLEGINNLVHAFATLDDANPEIEGNFIGQILRDNEIYLDAYLTDEQMGLLFDFERQQGYYTPDEIVEVNFVNNIGSILWDRGIDFSMLTDRYGRDAALAALNGQSYDYAFRRMVYDLKNTLALDSSQEVWLIENKEKTEAINDFLAINNSEERINVVKNLINLSINGEGADNFLFADCASWEYANQTDGAKACGVTDINNLFVAYRVENGDISIIEVPVFSTAPLYFTMPSHWTNGRAATVTAQQFNKATKNVELWFLTNPYSSAEEILEKWKLALYSEMLKVGGNISSENKHGVFRTAPFIRSFTETNCD